MSAKHIGTANLSYHFLYDTQECKYMVAASGKTVWSTSGACKSAFLRKPPKWFKEEGYKKFDDQTRVIVIRLLIPNS